MPTFSIDFLCQLPPLAISIEMLLRDLNSSSPSQEVQPVFDAFLDIQSSVGGPCGVLLQSEHSRLSGAIAACLRPDIFGPLSAEVVSAIAHHDDGWDASDQAQIENLSQSAPRPFTALSAEATLPSWIASIESARQLGPLQEILISRHCCLLGTGSGKHAAFVAGEILRRGQLERTLSYSPADLDRWTAALGFCDALSLYLCCGSHAPVKLLLAHPEAPGNARHITLQWISGQPHLSESVLAENASLQAGALCYRADGSNPDYIDLTWIVRSLPGSPVRR